MSARRPLMLALSILAGLSAAPGPRAGSAEDPPPQQPGQAAPGDLSAVKKVVVGPSTDPAEPGVLNLTAEVDPREVVVPPGPRSGTEAKLAGRSLTRSVGIDAGQLNRWQRRYLDDLRSAKARLATKGREVRRLLPAPAAPAPAPAEADVRPGRETVLAPYQGLPEADPAEEDRLIKNCIMITDLKVVNDARATGCGPWSFAHLMTQAANPAETSLSPAKFVRDWLRHWEADQSVGGNVAKARAAGIKDLILDPWPKLANGDLDLERAPFRLLAIGSRLDLRSNLVLGLERIGGGGAGEARFVFCAVNLKDKDPHGAPKPLPFTVIFEYEVKRPDYPAVREWAGRWYRLKDLELGSANYNRALQEITDEFAGADADPESPPNRSGLSQLRTNEIALGQPWELREFRLDAHNTGELRQVTVKQTPDFDQFNGFVDPGPPATGPGPKAASLARFINEREGEIVEQRHRTPVDFPTGQDFLGAAAPTPPNVFWTAPGIRAAEARHLFSLGTCSACHGREAFPTVGTAEAPFDDVTNPALAGRQPPHFTHVRPRLADAEAQLSAFLTGKDPAGRPFELADPEIPSKRRAFGDLPARANDLRGIVEYGTYYEMYRTPTQKVH